MPCALLVQWLDRRFGRATVCCCGRLAEKKRKKAWKVFGRGLSGTHGKKVKEEFVCDDVGANRDLGENL